MAGSTVGCCERLQAAFQRRIASITLEHLPETGEDFDYEGWRFEVVDLDGRPSDEVLAIPPKWKETPG
jgi:hypothetical protein